MSTMTDIDLRLADYRARTALINQQGWMSQASRPTGIALAARLAVMAAATRRHIGMFAFRARERLRLTPASAIADRAPA